jgi:hypothetical protein
LSINARSQKSMSTEAESKRDAPPLASSSPAESHVLFADTHDSGKVVGVVSSSEPSTLALLAAGVAGMAERRRRHQVPGTQPDGRFKQ